MIILFAFLVPVTGIFVQLFLMMSTLYEEKEIEEDWLYNKLRVNKIKMNFAKFIVMYFGYSVLAIGLPLFLVALGAMILQAFTWMFHINWYPMDGLNKTLSKLG